MCSLANSNAETKLDLIKAQLKNLTATLNTTGEFGWISFTFTMLLLCISPSVSNAKFKLHIHFQYVPLRYVHVILPAAL